MKNAADENEVNPKSWTKIRSSDSNGLDPVLHRAQAV